MRRSILRACLALGTAVACAIVVPVAQADTDAAATVIDAKAGRAERRVPTGFTDKPRWEFGVGGGYLESFDYPGSADPNSRGIALPFFIYRSPVLRLGDGGVRAVAIERPRFKVDVSFGGGLSSSSEAGGVREGLPDLDFLFEAGPRAQLIFLNAPSADGGRWQASLSVAVRGVISTDFGSLDGRGTLAEIGLNVTRQRVAGSRIDLIARLKPTWAGDRLHEYFYEVPPEFVTPERPAYDATGGYLGTDLFLGIAWRPTERFRLFLGAGLSDYSGAANVDSPLFEDDRSAGFALGFAWTIRQSEERVAVVDVE